MAGTNSTSHKSSIIIYGVSTTWGAFTAGLARLAGLSPIIGIAGCAATFAASPADHVIDYRAGEDAPVSSVENIFAAESLGTKVSCVRRHL